jgi:hypothetical protein
MGVVIEICIKYPGGRTRIRKTDIIHIYYIYIYIYIYSSTDISDLD